MSSDSVIPIHPAIITNPEKQQLLDTVAMAYDDLAKGKRGAPVAIIYALICPNNGAYSGFHTLDTIDGQELLYIGRGYLAITNDMAQWEQHFANL